MSQPYDGQEEGTSGEKPVRQVLPKPRTMKPASCKTILRLYLHTVSAFPRLGYQSYGSQEEICSQFVLLYVIAIYTMPHRTAAAARTERMSR